MSIKAILQGQNDKTPKLHVEVTKLPEQPSLPIAAGEDIPWSWAEINTIALSGNAESYFSLGSLKECNLSTAVLGSTNPKMMVIGINQDADGTVTFQTQNCLNETTAFDNNSAQWIGSTARQLCQDFYNACETKDFIKVVSKGTCPDISTGSKRNNNVIYNNETVWLPSEREMGLDYYSPLQIGYSALTKAECTYGKYFSYAYYNSNTSRMKNAGDSGNRRGYWERSRYFYDDSPTGVCHVGSNGTADWLYCNQNYFGLAPAFVIGNNKPTLIQDNEDVTDEVKEAINAANKDEFDSHVSNTIMHTTAEEKSKIANAVNPNLLKNWYFANPINSRGQTEYTKDAGVAYTIDRWCQNGSGVKLNDGYITTGAMGGIFQRIDNFSELKERMVTFSILTLENKLLSGSKIFNSSDDSFIKTDEVWLLYNSYFNGFQIAPIVTDSSLNIVAAKLELGDTQTLAHQDENGNWILNEIPNREEEYIKCITSTADASDSYANKVIATTGQLCNPNLLDNWYFARPVNQRGKTSYDASGYTIDQWVRRSADGELTLTANGLKFASNGGVSDIILDQQTELKLPDSGKATLSILVSEFNASSGRMECQSMDKTVYIESSGLYTITGDTSYFDGQNKIATRIYTQNVPSGGSVVVLAAKLELGDTQTLAHKEGDKWVLNEIPDYGEELRKCQRYCRVIGGTTNQPFCNAVRREATVLEGFIPIDNPFRTAPSVSVQGSFTVIPDFMSVEFTSGDTPSPQGVSLFFKRQDGGTFDKDAYLIYAGSDTRIILSADL